MRLGDIEISDDRLAILTELENELLKRTPSLSLRGTTPKRGALPCSRSCDDFFVLERPSNPMARTLENEIQ